MDKLEPRSPRKSKVVQGPSITERLIAAGEHLIGEFGTEAVSMRQVGLQAGTRNNYAVQYHFEDIDGLIRAVLLKQVPEVERRRVEFLAQYDGERTTLGLLHAFFKPLIGLIDHDRQPRFARFMLALHRSPTGWQPLDELFYMMQGTEQILESLQKVNSSIPAPVIWQRLRPISVMVLTYTCSGMHTALSNQVQEAIVDSLLDMAAAAMSVPVRETQVSKLYGFVY